jgi:hypothetical protein
MTIVFDDEELYTALKVQAARSHRPAKDIVADALVMLFEASQEEQRAIMGRARARDAGGSGGPDVEAILKELGLHRQPLEAHRS